MFKKRFFKSLLWLFAALLGVALLVFLGSILEEHSSLQPLMQVFSQHYWAWLIGRYTLYALLILGWPRLIQKLGRWRHWPKAYSEALAHQRLMLILILGFIEVFFVNNVPGHLLSHLMG